MVTFKIPISVLVVIHTPQLEILLLERADKKNFWQSVTGSLDYLDEPLETAALREVSEETGIHTADSSYILRNWEISTQYQIYSCWRHRYANSVTHNTEHWFSLEVPSPLTVELSPQEHVQSMWLPYQQAAEKCFSPSNQSAIKLLPQQLSPILSLNKDVI